MRKILITLACLSVSLVFIGTAFAGQTHVVDWQYNGNPASACTTGDTYHNSIQDAVNTIKNTGLDSGGCYPDSNNDGYRNPKFNEVIVVCPGTYTENVSISLTEACKPTYNMTIKSYSGNPADTVIQANCPNKSVFYVDSPGTDGLTITGFTIQGATGNNPTDPSCPATPSGALCADPIAAGGEDPGQPCAGIRNYCRNFGYINNNRITGNNSGIIIKDTAPGWEFYMNIENNEIDNNDTGIRLIYGTFSHVRSNNRIHDNTIGILLQDTWNQDIIGNEIYNNDIAIDIRTNYYSDAIYHYIYHNNLINNNTNRAFTTSLRDFNSDHMPDRSHNGQINGDGWFSIYSVPVVKLSNDHMFDDTIYDPWRNAWEVEWPGMVPGINREFSEYSADSPSTAEPAISLRGAYTQDKMTIKVDAIDKAKTGGNSNFFIVFAFNDATQKAYWAGARIGTGWTIEEVDANTGNYVILASAAETINTNTWYNLKVVISENTANLYANDIYKTSYTFPSGMPVGRVGLGAHFSHAHFDNFEIISENQVWDTNPHLNYWDDSISRGNYWSDNPYGLIIPFPAAYYDYYPLNGPFPISSDDLDGDGVVNISDKCPTIYNPAQADLDNDGKGDECDADIDGDGMSNAYESYYELNPWDSSDANTDSDGDGLTNYQESQFGPYPNNPNPVRPGGSNPFNADSDGDGKLDSIDKCSTLAPVFWWMGQYTNTGDFISSIQEGYTKYAYYFERGIVGNYAGINLQSELFQGEFIEDLLFNRNVTVKITGGGSCEYNFGNGKTAVKGNVRISSGTVTLGNFRIKQ